WDLEPWAGLALVLVKEGGEAAHIQRQASGVSAGDDQTVGLIGLVSLGYGLRSSDNRVRALSQSISWVSQSMSSPMPFFQASSRLSASTTTYWYIGTRYWRSRTNLPLVSCSPIGSSSAPTPADFCQQGW